MKMKKTGVDAQAESVMLRARWLGGALIGVTGVMCTRDLVVMGIVLLQEELQFVDLQEFSGYTGGTMGFLVAGAVLIGLGTSLIQQSHKKYRTLSSFKLTDKSRQKLKDLGEKENEI